MRFPGAVNITASAVTAFTVRPAVSVLANTADVSAARQDHLGVTEAIFWQDTPARLALPGRVFLTCDKKAAIVLRGAKGTLDVAVSDPTQLNTGTIELEITRPVGAVVSAAPEITVLQQTPTLKLRVDVRAARGKTFHATFATP